MSYRKKGMFANVSPYQTSSELENLHSSFSRTRNIVGIVLEERASGLERFLKATGWGDSNYTKSPGQTSREVSISQKGVGSR